LNRPQLLLFEFVAGRSVLEISPDDDVWRNEQVMEEMGLVMAGEKRLPWCLKFCFVLLRLNVAKMCFECSFSLFIRGCCAEQLGSSAVASVGQRGQSGQPARPDRQVTNKNKK
jgi:hypothetical protein